MGPCIAVCLVVFALGVGAVLSTGSPVLAMEKELLTNNGSVVFPSNIEKYVAVLRVSGRSSVLLIPCPMSVNLCIACVCVEFELFLMHCTHNLCIVIATLLRCPMGWTRTRVV